MQHGSLTKIRRRRGPSVWAYRWREPGATGKIVYHNLVIGTVEQLPNKSAARKATAGLQRQIHAQDPAGAPNHHVIPVTTNALQVLIFLS